MSALSLATTKKERTDTTDSEPNNLTDKSVCEHSEDFTSVIWFGQRYDFTKTQALCVKYLWHEWEKGELGLSEKTIGEKIDSADNNYKLRYTFRTKKTQHPAWRTMIQSCGKGVFRLVGPQKEQ